MPEASEIDIIYADFRCPHGPLDLFCKIIPRNRSNLNKQIGLAHPIARQS
jgi:hypothetical protein